MFRSVLHVKTIMDEGLRAKRRGKFFQPLLNKMESKLSQWKAKLVGSRRMYNTNKALVWNWKQAWRIISNQSWVLIKKYCRNVKPKR